MTRRVTVDNSDLRSRMRSPVRRAPQYVTRPNYVQASSRNLMQDVRPVKAIAQAAVKQPVPEPPRRPKAGRPMVQRQQPSKVLVRKAVKRQTVSKRPSRRLTRSNLLTGMAVVIFLLGLGVTYNGLKTNKKIEAQVERVSAQADDAAGEGSGAQDPGATPSTTKPTSQAVRSYAVAPNLPRYIDIGSLSVHARVMSMGVTASNQLRAPTNVHDAGWYNASAQPGQPGAMLVDGHISSWKTKGVFYGINKLKAGAPIKITRGDGKVFTYVVTSVEVKDADKVDMASLLLSADQSKPGLNLISCFGDVIPGTNEFNKRVIVRAVLQ